MDYVVACLELCASVSRNGCACIKGLCKLKAEDTNASDLKNIQKYILSRSIEAVNRCIAAKAADQILPSVYMLVCRPHALLSCVHPQFMSSVG